ncbi:MULTISPECIES: alanine/glycine:cation symporter family protein [Spongiibacter]|mgnify:FL=1|uniref:alanine/glycine:cation symporter family protein n=1 Tax=Spongiibacter TaxID=630749 RepID=UPI001B08AB80|nr:MULTISPECIES: alanine/glycine:cation symporter family protein [Spongiibacter]MBO6751699.1 alanine:cation symporter family protein [Spongiibacter sp.]|tara:strand:- start:3603 stop:4973 length:1371 start_codon:yes stop_codon:yes gene_type:complete
MTAIENLANQFANTMWGTPMLLLLVGGGLFLTLYSRLQCFRFLPHAIAILRGRYDDPQAPGQINHAQALSTALSGTLGLGNIAGVAIAISTGGPGAIFWMWVTAIVGVSTKFYTASLAVMFRGRDDNGLLRGGPMYVIREGLGRKWQPLAVIFAIAGMLGTLPLFQANQLLSLLETAITAGNPLSDQQSAFLRLSSSIVLAVLVALVVAGKITRIGALTVRLVPSMVALYLGVTVIAIAEHADRLPGIFALILSDAFSGNAIAGGTLGSMIMIGVRRGAFSNEAGIGTESMAHGEAKTHEPVREGLVAMVGPLIDTLLVCTCTALLILLTGVWQQAEGITGVNMTAAAMATLFPSTGQGLLLIMVALLSFSTMVSFWFYGAKCADFLFGSDKQRYYTIFYISLIVVGSLASLNVINAFLIGVYAVMAFPTMISTLALAPRVNAAARDYFKRLRQNR